MSAAPQTGIPIKWRYTWETQSHTPTLRLFVFNPKFKPSHHCRNLKVTLNLEHSLLLVSWDREETDVHLSVPVPRVLFDVGSPVDFKAMEGHIEVKLVLLLPVDHPLNMNIESVFDEDFDRQNVSADQLHPLSVDTDLKCLSSQNGVHLFCKSCSMKLTRSPLRSFVEMPSVDWREVADNWFGNCCCSFGRISEKLVRKYDSSYLIPQGTCLLDAACIIVTNDDIEEYLVPGCYDQSGENDYGCGRVGEKNSESLVDCQRNGRQSLFLDKQHEITSKPMDNLENEVIEISESSASLEPVYKLCTSLQNHCCVDNMFDAPNHDHDSFSHDISIISSKDEELAENMESLKNHKSLNTSLGSGFMVRTSNISKDVDWIKLHCTQCSSVVGVYPSAHDGHVPLDGGIRFFKCHTSTGLPVTGSGNIFRKYTLQRLFVKQLMESASDELSFRTVVRDLRTRTLMLQIVLLNSDVWSCTGYCFETENVLIPSSKVDLLPVVKVLFSDCSNATEAQLRMLEEWATKNQADEVYMLKHQIKELTDSLESAKSGYPFLFSFMQGLSLSSIER